VLTKSLSVKKVYILNDKEAYGLGVASNFRNAAQRLGLSVAGFTAWDGKASSYEALAVKIKASGAQGVFLGGLICENGGKLIKDLRNGLGPNVKIIAPDGFTPVSATIQQGGSATEKMFVSVAGLPNSALTGAGKAFVVAFTVADHKVPDPYSVYAAQAAEVLVQAIKQSNGSRADVAKQLFKVHLTNSILGNVSFNSNGDVSSNPVTIYRVTGAKSNTYRVIVPPKSLVKIA
jgi:branched-chain amino acid transport system substrate-binding protein